MFWPFFQQKLLTLNDSVRRKCEGNIETERYKNMGKTKNNLWEMNGGGDEKTASQGGGK